MGTTSLPPLPTSQIAGHLREPVQTLSTYLVSTVAPPLRICPIQLAPLTNITPKYFCPTHPASNPRRNWHHSKVCPALGRGENNHTHTPMHLQSQQTSSAQRVPCQSVLGWKQACVLTASSTQQRKPLKGQCREKALLVGATAACQMGCRQASGLTADTTQL